MSHASTSPSVSIETLLQVIQQLSGRLDQLEHSNNRGHDPAPLHDDAPPGTRTRIIGTTQATTIRPGADLAQTWLNTTPLLWSRTSTQQHSQRIISFLPSATTTKIESERYTPLIRYINDPTQSLGHERISHYIQEVMQWIPRVEGQPKYKARRWEPRRLSNTVFQWTMLLPTATGPPRRLWSSSTGCQGPLKTTSHQPFFPNSGFTDRVPWQGRIMVGDAECNDG
ncbi:hypothetical protein BGZ89_004002 [Linnemannia elongata]|nr:hypothetical protein BGZ89_004002 [Linnemannia elongata]